MFKNLVADFLELIAFWGKKTTPHPEELLKIVSPEPIIEVTVETLPVTEEIVHKKTRKKKTSDASKK